LRQLTASTTRLLCHENPTLRGRLLRLHPLGAQ
jgi:hypothetical protein